MVTDLQDVFDSFFIKFPNVNFTEKESKVFQYFKIALAKCKRSVYENLEYVYDTNLESGYFVNTIPYNTIELIAICMAKEYSLELFTLASARKQYIGTQAFNKLPDKKIDFESAKQLSEFWKTEFENFKSEFPDYSEER